MNEVYDWFINFTSLGGYTQFLASKDKSSKNFWAFLTLIGLIFTGISFERSFVDFLEYDVTVSISVTDNTTLKFPTVTICNSNRVHCGRLLERINAIEDVRYYLFFSFNSPALNNFNGFHWENHFQIWKVTK